MQGRRAVVVFGVGAVGGVLIVADTFRPIDAPWAAGLLIVGALLVLGACVAAATLVVMHRVQDAVNEANRPANEAFSTGWDLGKASGYREGLDECRRKHMSIVRAIRH